MKNGIKKLFCVLGVSFVLNAGVYANTSYVSQSPYYGGSYNYGSYNYGQGYTGTSYVSSYYGQGYGNYMQGYQGSYQSGYNSGMGNHMSWVDNNWIEDQLKFAVSDVNQNRPYQAIQKLQMLSGYASQFGDSALYRRVLMASQLGYKTTLVAEVNSIYNDWKAGNLRVGWESAGNQSYQGQDDISKEYIVAQLQAVAADLSSNNQNRGRQRLMSLQNAIPPLGNDRLVRRVYYASTVTKPSQMKSEVDAMIAEIQAGTLVLNDTENTAQNFYYGSSSSYSPYGQQDQMSTGYTQYLPTTGGATTNYGGAVTTPYYGGTSTGNGADMGLPAFGTVNYSSGSGLGSLQTFNGASTHTGTSVNTQTTGVGTAGTLAPVTSTTTSAPAADLTQLKANVAATYSDLKQAIASGDRDRIQTARTAYMQAQQALDQAK